MAVSLDLAALSVAVVMPAYNEADSIEGFLDDLVSQITPEVGELAIVVVDDLSTDNTVEVVNRYAAAAPCNVSIVPWSVNRGHGPTSLSAYWAGRDTGADIIVHVDGDGQFDALDVAAMLREVARESDAVLGIRYARSDPWFRKVLTRSVRVYLRVVAGLKVQDANCPLRAYRREALLEILDLVPAEPMIPTLYLSILSEKYLDTLVEMPVRSLPRRGDVATGTMWGGARSELIPSKRLVKFVWGALKESLITLPCLGRNVSRPQARNAS